MKLTDTRWVDIWQVPLDGARADEATLSADERGRAARFLAERDARRFVNAHVALRDILSVYVERRAQALSFRVNEFGKPHLAMVTDVEFNMAHSGECALVAVTHGAPVGVDVEWARPDFEGMDLARRFFAPREIELLDAEPARFFEIWTRKESFLKAVGMGVSFPLNQCDVCERQVQFAGSIPLIRPRDWFVTTFYLNDGYIGAVAAAEKDMMVRHFVWSGTDAASL